MTCYLKMGLWQRLSVGMVKDVRVLTRTTLGEHGQRLAMASALRSRHSDHLHLIDSAIK